MSPALQAKFLRVLQEREYEPLGGVETVRANVRIVAATNKKLVELVREEKFRDDLYFRLSVARLTIPSLRERREDIPYLVERFVERFNAKRGKQIQGVTPEVMEILMRHTFPGNARELENIIEYGFVLCHNRFIEIRHLPEDLKPDEEPVTRTARGDSVSRLQQSEAHTIQIALSRNQGHQGHTAEELGISRTTLWRKLQKYDINPEDYKVPH